MGNDGNLGSSSVRKSGNERRIKKTASRYPHLTTNPTTPHTKNMDPSQPLKNARHEQFAQAVAAGVSATAAYRKAGYAARDADVTGPRLLGKVGIKGRVQWLLSQAATATVMDLVERRERLARIARGAHEPRDIIAAIKADHEMAPREDGGAAEIVIRIGA